MCMSCAVGVPLPLKTAVGIPLCSAASPHADALVLYSLRPLKQCPLTTNLLTHLQLLATAADVCSVDAEASAPDSPGPRPEAARLRCDSLPVAAVAAGADGGDGGARGGVGSSEGGGAAQGGDTRASFKRALSLGASLDTRGRRRSRQLRLRRESRLGDAEAVRGCRLDDFDCVIAGIAHAESAPVATRLLLRRPRPAGCLFSLAAVVSQAAKVVCAGPSAVPCSGAEAAAIGGGGVGGGGVGGGGMGGGGMGGGGMGGDVGGGGSNVSTAAASPEGGVSFATAGEAAAASGGEGEGFREGCEDDLCTDQILTLIERALADEGGGCVLRRGPGCCLCVWRPAERRPVDGECRCELSAGLGEAEGGLLGRSLSASR